MHSYLTHLGNLGHFGSSTYMSIHQVKSYAYTLHLFWALLAISYPSISFSLISLLYSHMHIYIFTSLRTALFFGHFWSMVSVFLRGSILIGIGHLITGGGGLGHSHSAYAYIHIYIVTDGTIFWSFLVNG